MYTSILPKSDAAVGKTYTSVSFIYWLIKIAGAKRVLSLVDRKNLGEQTQKEFQQYVTLDDGRKFTELYNVHLLSSKTIDPVNKVCINTIQLTSLNFSCSLNDVYEDVSLPNTFNPTSM